MLDRWFGPKIHHSLHLLGMMILAFGLPFNKVLMSIGAIWGVGNLLLEGKFRTYFEKIKKNKAFLFLLAFFALHLIALLWTENFDYALHDLRIKLPLLVVPLALVAHPIDRKKEIHWILLTFLTSLFLISLVNGYHYSTMSALEIGNNFREISIFGSHIRFSILVVIGTVLSIYFFFVQKTPWKYIFLVLSLWFLAYTYFSQVLSGPLSIAAVVAFLFLYWIYPIKLLRFTFIAGCISLFSLAVYSVQSTESTKPYDFSKLETTSAHNHGYYHDTTNLAHENGKPIYIYICYDELEEDWLKHFSIPRNGLDKKGYEIEGTFFRYMTAKNLRKDRDGLNQLTPIDIQNIENGIATPEHLKVGFKGRLAGLSYALENDGDPNNSTILQRIEYWKTADQIILDNPILGVGTGDVQDAFNKQYEINNSKLKPVNRLRAHNMFLTIQLTFGILGTLVMLFFIAIFLMKNRAAKNLLAFCIFGAIIASFFVEDTLETQTGVTLFSFFLGLFLIEWKTETKIASDK